MQFDLNPIELVAVCFGHPIHRFLLGVFLGILKIQLLKFQITSLRNQQINWFNQGSLNYSFNGGDQTLQMYGKFKGFPFYL